MTYGELFTVPSPAPNVIARQPKLCCLSCEDHDTYSANPGDYWQRPKHEEIVCANCGEPMILVDERTIIVPWDKSEFVTRAIRAAFDADDE